MLKKQQKVHTKDLYIEALKPELEYILKHKVSKTDAFQILRAVLLTGYVLSEEKPVSLSGVGRFERIITKVARKYRMKFRVSEKIQTLANEEGGLKTAYDNEQLIVKKVSEEALSKERRRNKRTLAKFATIELEEDDVDLDDL